MRKNQFSVGQEFLTATGRWICTEVYDLVVYAKQIYKYTMEGRREVDEPPVPFDRRHWPACNLPDVLPEHKTIPCYRCGRETQKPIILGLGFERVGKIRRGTTVVVCEGCKQSDEESAIRFPKYKWVCLCKATIWSDDPKTSETCVSCGRDRAFWEDARKVVFKVFLQMHEVQQMLAFLYHIARSKEVTKREIYDQFFEAPFVKQYCDREGIDQTTVTAAEHRCPFLLNILEACGIVETDTRRVTVKKLVLAPFLVAPYTREEEAISAKRLQSVYTAWPTSDRELSPEDISIVRELFGPEFLTAGYFLQDMMIIED